MLQCLLGLRNVVGKRDYGNGHKLPAEVWQQNVLLWMKITRDGVLYDDGKYVASGYCEMQGEGVSRDTPCLWFPALVGFFVLWLRYWRGILTTVMANFCYVVACFDKVLDRNQPLHQLWESQQRACWRDRTNWPSLCQERSFSCVLIKQVRRICKKETGSVWTGKEVEEHRNKRMSVFVCRHQFLRVTWNFAKKPYSKFEIQIHFMNLCWAQNAAVRFGQYLSRC